MAGLINPITAGLALGALAAALENQGPRSRSEWKLRFDAWTSPSSTTEDKRVSGTDRAVRAALAEDVLVTTYDIRVVAQGSSVNNTNTRLRSDLDLVVVSEAEVWHRPAPGEPFPPDFTPGTQSMDHPFAEFREAVHSAVARGISGVSVSGGNKAIKLKATSDSRVDCDVVPAFRFKQFIGGYTGPSHTRPTANGVAFYSQDGDFVVSFPEFHLERGRKKNVSTGNRYKHVVRVLKKLRDQFAADALPFDELPSSYEIECLAFNTPEHVLTAGDIYDGVHGCLGWLQRALSDNTACNRLVQVHGVYALYPRWYTGLLGQTPRSDEASCAAAFVDRALRTISPRS